MAGLKGRGVGEGGLTAFAKALVAEKGKGAATPPPAAAAPAEAPPPAPPASEPDALAEFQARVDKVLERIVAASRSPGMKGDPYWRDILVAQAAQVELLPELVRLIHAGRAPLSDEATAALVELVGERVDRRIQRESSRWYRRLDRRTSVAIGLGLGGAFILGCVVAFATAFRLLAG